MAAVIVAGATSQIGRFLLPRMVAAGHTVVALSRRPPRAAINDGVRWQSCDLARPDALVFPQADVLIHIASLRLLPEILPGFFANGGRRVICFGTTSRHSKAASAAAHEQEFAAMQIAAEQVIGAACSAAGAHWTLFRPTLIYGCELDRNVTLIARLIRRLGFFPLLGPASGRRQPVHADDLAAACVAVMDAPSTYNKAYELTGGETLSYRQMVARIFVALNRPARFVRVPMTAFRAALWLFARVPRFRDFNAEMARRMNDDLVFDSTAAMRDFGYAPRPFRPEFSLTGNHAE